MSLLYIEKFIRYSRFVGDESRDFANIIFFFKKFKIHRLFCFYIEIKNKDTNV